MDEFLGPRISSTEEPDVKMILCHFSEAELEGLDNLQGGPSIDPSTGLREYSKLAELIENPEIQNVFKQVNEEVKSQGEVSPHLHEIYKEAEQTSLPFKKVPEDSEEPAHALEELGRHGDTLLALVPLNLASFLCDLKGEATLNPKTGLLEFFLGKIVRAVTRPIARVVNAVTGGRGNEIVRIAGTIGGALLGTLYGQPGIGAGIGNALASYGTGKGFGQSAWSGLKNYGLATGIHGAGQALGLNSATPYTAGLFGGSNPLMSAYYGATQGTGLAASNAPTLAQVAGAPTTPAATATPGILGGLQGLATSPLGLMAGVGGLSYLGSKKHHEHEKKRVDEHNREIEKQKHEQGFNLPWEYAPRPERLKRNPKYEHGNGETYYIHSYREGGQIKSSTESSKIVGKGNGQDDAIKTTIPEKSYIIDATTVAHLGDGSSSSGLKVLEETAKKIKSKFPKPLVNEVTKVVKKTCKQVPVRVANEEFKFDPVTVTLAGHGDAKKGAEVFKTMVHNIRKHKASNGLGLPPRAKDPLAYMQKVG